MDYEVNPFIPDEFDVQVEEGLTEVQEQDSVREQIENTIRWRRVKENGMDVSWDIFFYIHILIIFCRLYNPMPI